MAWSNLLFVYNSKQQLPSAYANVESDEELGIQVRLVDGYDGKSVGLHKAYVTINNSNYKLSGDIEVEYEIAKAVVSLPEDFAVYYTGVVNEIKLDKGLTVINNDMIAVGVYQLEIMIENFDHYEWSDGSTEQIRVVEYTILHKDISDSSVSINNVEDQVYTGKQIKPVIIVTYRNQTLVAGVDYTITYTNNIEVFSKAKITIKGINNFVGEVTREFYIYSNVMKLEDSSNFKFMELVSQGVYKDHEHAIYNKRVKVLIEIPARMTVTDFLNNFIEGQRDYIKIVSGMSYVPESKYDTTYIGSGTEIVFQSSKGSTLDIVKVSVRGDINGDGFMNYYDIQALSDIISTRNYDDYSIFYAADLDGDGSINVNDVFVLQSMLG